MVIQSELLIVAQQFTSTPSSSDTLFLWARFPCFCIKAAYKITVSEAVAGLEDHVRMLGAWVPPSSWEAELANRLGIALLLYGAGCLSAELWLKLSDVLLLFHPMPVL